MNRIQISQGDITTIPADAIVNAANSSLLGGGGVDGAIHRVGGPEILDACRKVRNRQGGCEVGSAVITTAGNLPANYVIHTVGPHWNGGDKQEAELLRQAYLSCFKLIDEYAVKSVSFPNISTGIYKFPKKIAAEIALETIYFCLSKNRDITSVNLVCFDLDNYLIYRGIVGGGGF